MQTIEQYDERQGILSDIAKLPETERLPLPSETRKRVEGDEIFYGVIARAHPLLFSLAQALFASPNLPALRVFAWGDFSHYQAYGISLDSDNRFLECLPNLLLCRKNQGVERDAVSLNFAPWYEASMWDKTLVEDNRDFLEACPIKQFLG